MKSLTLRRCALVLVGLVAMANPALEFTAAIGLALAEDFHPTDQADVYPLTKKFHPLLATGGALIPAGVVRARLR